MIHAIHAAQQSLDHQAAAASVAEISIEEIEARENAVSNAVYCCILNISF